MKILSPLALVLASSLALSSVYADEVRSAANQMPGVEESENLE